MKRPPPILLFVTIVVGLIAAYNFFPQLPGSDFAWLLPIILGTGVLVAVAPTLLKSGALPGNVVAARKPDRVLLTTLWIGVGLVLASAPIMSGFFLGTFVFRARLVPDIPISVFWYATDVLLLGVTLILFSTVLLMLGIRGDRVLGAMKYPEKSKPPK